MRARESRGKREGGLKGKLSNRESFSPGQVCTATMSGKKRSEGAVESDRRRKDMKTGISGYFNPHEADGVSERRKPEEGYKLPRRTRS